MDQGLVDDGFGGLMNLIYDDELNITWLGDTNFGAGSAIDDGFSPTDGKMTWQNALNWAGSLTVGGFTDWRLPSADLNGDGTVVNCFGGGVAGCADNEMGFLYWEEGITSVAPGPFSNLQPTLYWSGTVFSPNTIFAWAVGFSQGIQNPVFKDDIFIGRFAWAVRDGDVGLNSIPEPSTMLLFCSGLAGLVAWRYRKHSRS